MTLTLALNVAYMLPGPHILLLACGLNGVLYGVLLSQVYLYHQAFQDDSLLSKTLVYGLLAIETVQTTMTFYYTYILAVLVVNGNTLVELQLRSPPLVRIQTFSEVSVYLLGGIRKSSLLFEKAPTNSFPTAACTVQLFYCYRIGILSRSWVASTAIGLVSLIQFAAAIAAAIKSTELFGFITTLIWGGCGVICDILIVVFMTWKLKQRDTGLKSTHAILTRLIRRFVEAGTLTVLMACSLLFFFIFSDQVRAVYFIPALTLGKFYANTMMFIFNTRIHISSDQTEGLGKTMSDPDLRGLSGLAGLETAPVVHSVHNKVADTSGILTTSGGLAQ